MKTVKVGDSVRINQVGINELRALELELPMVAMTGEVVGLDVVEGEFAVEVAFDSGVIYSMTLDEIDLVPKHKWVGEYSDTGSMRTLHFSGGEDGALTFSIREGGHDVSESSFVCLHPQSLLWLYRDIKAVLKTQGMGEELNKDA